MIVFTKPFLMATRRSAASPGSTYSWPYGERTRAAIDVFDIKPLPVHHPLRSLSNALLTGHVGYVTRDLYTIFYRDAEEDIAAFQAGSPIRLIE